MTAQAKPATAPKGHPVTKPAGNLVETVLTAVAAATDKPRWTAGIVKRHLRIDEAEYAPAWVVALYVDERFLAYDMFFHRTRQSAEARRAELVAQFADILTAA